MFTIEQIKQAHSQVTSGVDFPAYVSEIGKLGVVRYETYVADGHTDYYGAGGFTVSSPAAHAPLNIAQHADVAAFNEALKAHQQGATDYPAFIVDCAGFGVEKWEVKVDEMTCAYYDMTGRVVLEESIPQVD